MLKFGLAISVWIIDTIVNNPKLIQRRVDIHASDNAYAFDNTMCVTAILTPHQFDIVRIVLICHCIVKDQVAFGRLNDFGFDVLPGQFRAKFFSIQIAIQGIMAELLTVFGKIRQRIINLANQQVLAISQARDSLGF